MNLFKNSSEDKTKTSFLGAIFHGAAFYILMVLLVVGIVFGFKVYLQEKDVSLVIADSSNVRVGDNIKLSFSTNMLQRSVEETLTIEPKIKFRTNWQTSKSLWINILEPPTPGTEYKIKIDKAKTQFYVPQAGFIKTFTAPVFPKIKAIYPNDNQKEVDIAEHIVIDFDKTIQEPFSVDVKIVPSIRKFEKKFNISKTQLVIAPLPSMEKKTEYEVVVVTKHNSLGLVGEERRSKFVTKPPPPVYYSYANKLGAARMEDRLEEIDPQITEGKYIDIDISSQTMFIFQNGKEKGAFKISSGKRGMDTPLGVFKVMAKAKRPWSQMYSLYMPWFIQFTNQGHGIHELPEWPSGYKEGTNHLGIPVSHGCVRLGIGPAQDVYNFADVGTPIVIHR